MTKSNTLTTALFVAVIILISAILFFAVMFKGETTLQNQPAVQNTQNTSTQNQSLTNHFNAPLVIALNQKISVGDGMQLTLTDINDSRCKQGVVCVWAGELSYQFMMQGVPMQNQPVNFKLGTNTTRSLTLDGYVITLTNGTQANATITVAKIVK